MVTKELQLKITLWDLYIFWETLDPDIDGLVQDCSNSSALAMELLQSCTKPSICHSQVQLDHVIPKLIKQLFYYPAALKAPGYCRTPSGRAGGRAGGRADKPR